jgi:acyl-CoA thioester hydrolase
VRVATQILGSDDKRLHLGHEMFRSATGERAATQELMFLHIDMRTRRVSPFPPGLRDRVADRDCRQPSYRTFSENARFFA